jgi:Holliday junction DNA helicase RuvA
MLRGKLLESEADGSLLVDVGGVGYEVAAPVGTAGRAGRAEGDEVALYVHTHVPEGSIALYGFATRAERTAFRALIAVQKVGPKMALAVLSVLAVDELLRVIESGDTRGLVRVPGVGKKMADRLVLELKDKLRLGLAADRLDARAGAGRATAERRAGADDRGAVVHEALVRLGFKPAEADHAVSSLGDLERPIGDLVREALAVLAP